MSGPSVDTAEEF